MCRKESLHLYIVYINKHIYLYTHMMKYDVYVSLHNIYLDFLDQQSEKTIPHASFCKTC